MRRRAFAKPKETDRPSEDVLRSNRQASRYALSDGASTSFAPRCWAQALCRQFIADPELRADWIQNARGWFQTIVTLDGDDWSAWHAFGRGSFATFLGFSLLPGQLIVQAIGDTCLFLMTPSGVEMFPALSYPDFQRPPVLLCSHPGRGAFLDTDEAFLEIRHVREISDWTGMRLAAMTDALAEWVVADEGGPHSRLTRLLEIRDRKEFSTLIEDEIGAGRLRDDDATLIVIDGLSS